MLFWFITSWIFNIHMNKPKINNDAANTFIEVLSMNIGATKLNAISAIITKHPQLSLGCKSKQKNIVRKIMIHIDFLNSMTNVATFDCNVKT